MRLPEAIFQAIFVLLLFWEAVADLKCREISKPATALLLLCGVFGFVFAGERSVLDLLAACLPGACMLGLSFASGGKMGMGDGIVLLLAAFYLPLLSLVILLSVALTLSAIYAATLLLRHKSHATFPFLPFLIPGYVVLLLLGG